MAWINNMKKLTHLIFIAILFIGVSVTAANAQMMMGRSFSAVNWDEVVEHTIREEAEGKELWEKLQAQQVTCAELSDHDFGTLGEYFMGQMMGDSHAAMNAMMIQMHGEEGEEQIHIVMGKRLSGCDASAVVTSITGGWMPMMNMMTGGWSSPFGNNPTNSMMNFGFGPFGGFGWIFMILWWVLIIAGIVALIKWLTNQFRGTHNHEKSALDILKERYAKGEIDKKEFEEKKKELS
jgi:putative membrane protein